MLQSGLLSITFRQLEAAAVIDLAAEAGLDSIEWGGEEHNIPHQRWQAPVHVPHGATDTAVRIREQTAAAGLAISAYGSYYRVGESEAAGQPFAAVLDTAQALQTPTLRVWAGRQGSAEASPEYRAAVVQDSQRIAAMAAEAGITVSFEFHGDTLTDTNESALQLLREANHSNLQTFWQPHNGTDMEERLGGLKSILPWLSNVHIFYWRNFRDRFPLAEGENIWLPFLRTIKESGRDHYVSMEFVQDNDPDNFRRDAKVLKRWLAQVNHE